MSAFGKVWLTMVKAFQGPGPPLLAGEVAATEARSEGGGPPIDLLPADAG